jgi:hypothetical protein
MSDPLLDIPSWLSAAIIRDWLTTTKALTMLDTAYCTVRTRILFLKAIKVAKFILSVEKWLPTKKLGKFASWVVKRELSVGRLALAGCLPVFNSLPFIKRISATLTAIKLKSTPTVVTLVGNTCSRIRDGELYDCSDLEAVGAFLQGVHSTTERLVLTGCRCENHPGKCNQPALHSMRFSKLTVLTFNNSLSAVWCNAIIERCPVLQHLSVRTAEQNIRPLLLDSLKRITLDLHRSVQYTSVLCATPLPLLEVLSLTGFNFAYSGNLAAMLPRWPLLRAVALQGSCVVDDCLEAIAQIPTLCYFNANNSNGFTAAGIARIIKSYDELTDLSVQNLKLRLDDSGIVDALRTAVKLQSLDVGDNALGPEIVAAIAQLPDLQELGVCGARFTAESAGLVYIAERAPRLRIVRVAGSTEVLSRSLWRKVYPDINLVTNRVSSELWSTLDFPTAPAVDLSITG